MNKKTLWLAKSRIDVCCHCRCDPGLAGAPGQLDCPSCGCSWLFMCFRCRHAFTFARCVPVSQTIEEIARADWVGTWKQEPSKEELADWANGLREWTADIEEGQEYVYLDGAIIPADASPIELDGLYARHQLERLPQVEAIERPEVLDDTLANGQYWADRRIAENEEA